MATVLNNHTLEDLRSYQYMNNAELYWADESLNKAWIQKMRSEPDSEDREPLEWAEMMLHKARTARPTASQVRAKITDSNSGHPYFCFHCLEEEQEGPSQATRPGEVPDPELVTASLLRSYIQRRVARGAAQGIGDEQESTDENDRVTSKMLEDAGVVTVPTDGGTSTGEKLEQHEAGIGTRASNAKQIGRNENTQTRYPPAKPETEGTPVKRGMDTERGPPSAMGQESRPASHLASKTTETKPDKQPTATKQVRFEASTEPLIRWKRFTGLHAESRPAPSEPIEEPEDAEDTPIVSPKPLVSPPLDQSDCYPLPDTTLVPSYILAGANRFTMSELSASNPGLGRYNMFVYGRLMFPSILRAFAASSLQGIESHLHKRRLTPSSSDWARINVSIQRAAEAMAPARLKGYDVWRPSHMDCAVIQEKSWTAKVLDNRRMKNFPGLESDPPGEVTGFLILGLGEEVLEYCDLVFASDRKFLKRANAESDEPFSEPKVTGLLERKLVTVDVQLTSGEFRSVAAYTYVWAQGADHLRHAWRPEGFVRRRDFQQLSDVESIDWRAEEQALAKTMHIAYALVGDELCVAILSDDFAKLTLLLKDGNNPDGRCKLFGTPLQAAVATNQEEMVRLLLSYDANPSLKGGKYGTPLIAATVGSRQKIIKILLKHRADVFASNPQYVNALYQAVGKGDIAIATMLLEAGAWMGREYGEMYDLAIERQDRDMQALLLDYDVREAFRDRLLSAGSHQEIIGRDHHEDESLARTSTQVLKSVITNFISLSSRPGRWTGHKGVVITRAALRAGAPPIILDYIRGAISPIQKLIDILKAADKRKEDENEWMMDVDDRVVELNSDEDEEPVIEGPKTPVIKVTNSGYNHEIAPYSYTTSTRSRNSSISSIRSTSSSGSDDRVNAHDRNSSDTEAGFRKEPPIPTEPVASTPKPREEPYPTRLTESPKPHTRRYTYDLGPKYAPRDYSHSTSDTDLNTVRRSPTPRVRAEPPVGPASRRSTLGAQPIRSTYSRQDVSPQYLVSTPTSLLDDLS